MNILTINCYQCGGAVDISPDTARHICPYCDGDVWAPITSEAAGEASQRLMQAMERYQVAISQAQQKIMNAVQAGDLNALREAVEAEASWTFRAYDDAKFWHTIGRHSPEAIAAHKEQHLDQIFRAWEGQIPESAASIENSAQQAQWTYHEAFATQDVDELVRRFTAEMSAYIANSPDWAGQSKRDQKEAVRTSLETVLREQPWVSDGDLRRHGFEIYSGDSVEFLCENCGAPGSVKMGVESVKCEFCSAVTQIRLTGDQRLEAFESGRQSARDLDEF